MIFRDYDKKIEPPYKKKNDKGREVWFYPDPIYHQVEDCFLRTQRPEGVTKYKNDKPRLRDPFRKINKFKMQKYLNHTDKEDYRELDWATDENGIVRAALIYYDISKMSNKKKNVVSFTQRKIELSENDSYIFDVACDVGYERWLGFLMERHYSKNVLGTTVVECDMQHKQIRTLFETLGFERIDNKVTSFADMYGIWCKQNVLLPIEKIEESQECSLQRLIMDVPPLEPLLNQVKELEDEMFANHYSNYNKGNTWSGVVIRGYGGKEDFIIKPSEMTNSWKKENKEKLEWICEDTPLRKRLDEVEKFIDVLDVSEVERVRVLKLSKGEGELQRHTDIQDKEAGINDGQWARLHFPLQTNKKVIFTQWNTDGTETTTRMRLNELWYLDMRKPHTAVNFGEEDRYHLIIDVKADERLRAWLRRSLVKYPPFKQTDDYEN